MMRYTESGLVNEKCPICGGEMFWRRYNTPVDGKVKVTLAHGCQHCHTATLEDVD